MLSAVIDFERSYPTMLLVQQLEHQRFTILGPLVQKNDSLSFFAQLLLFSFAFYASTLNKDSIYLPKAKVEYFKNITPKKDRIRTVSQRTKPNSRTAFIGEQPNPWNLLQLQDAMSRHRGAKRLRR